MRSHRMDPRNTLWMDAYPEDDYWESCYRRDYTDRDCLRWDLYSGRVCEVSRYYEEIGDDLGRHERMAEAMYDC